VINFFLIIAVIGIIWFVASDFFALYGKMTYKDNEKFKGYNWSIYISEKKPHLKKHIGKAVALMHNDSVDYLFQLMKGSLAWKDRNPNKSWEIYLNYNPNNFSNPPGKPILIDKKYFKDNDGEKKLFKLIEKKDKEWKSHDYGETLCIKINAVGLKTPISMEKFWDYYYGCWAEIAEK